MKTLLSSAAAIFILLLIGCQESSITDPVMSKTAGTNLNADFSYNHNFIKFDRILVDPSAPLRNYLQIKGEVEYEHRVVLLDPMQPAPQEYIQLRMSMSAEIKDPNSPLDIIWTVEGESEDIIYVKNDNVEVLLKNYFIEGRDDGMSLVVRFYVSNDGLQLNSMWLDLNVDKKFDKNSTPPDTITYPPVQILYFD
ncbi:MAG: hypothetical protein KJN64_01915 [Ignavibacteria bacterium]|nr:hypothetical protein [Ignavibacteria bacterium]MBT8383345.1 hypothetical protein [Ignavibacteria bacterium]MBT8391417.1 hypothetical protein [Ignavibacteria bacterium]NNJ52405.1 hypothetical protein [Ignavibacteriaceae bacterium]NNL19855.1 hypothetical protein [Ignavibacteriaceae bacterium]